MKAITLKLEWRRWVPGGLYFFRIEKQSSYPRQKSFLRRFGTLLGGTLFLVTAQMTLAATTGNIVTLEQVGDSTRAEINIRQDGLSNFIGGISGISGETGIAQIERTVTFYSLGDDDGDGFLTSRIVNVSCGVNCSNGFRLIREGEDVNGDGDNDDPGELGDVDGDPDTNGLYYENQQGELVFVADDDPRISTELDNALRTYTLTLFNGNSSASTTNGIDNTLSIRQDGVGNQASFEINSDGSQFNQVIFGVDNKTSFQTGRSDRKQDNVSLRFEIDGSNNAIASRIGSSDAPTNSDSTTIEVDFLGSGNVIEAVSDGIDNEIFVRGSFSSSALGLGSFSDNSEIIVNLKSTANVNLSAFQSGVQQGLLGSQNSLKVDWSFGSGSSLGFLQQGTGNTINLLNSDGGQERSIIDIYQFGDGHQSDIDLIGGGQLVNIFQGPVPIVSSSAN